MNLQTYDKDIALLFGINEAIILQVIYDFLKKHDVISVKASINDLHGLMPYYSEKTIIKVLNNLEDYELIKIEKVENRKRYTITEQGILLFQNYTISQIDEIEYVFQKETNLTFTKEGKRIVKRLIKTFGFENVLTNTIYSLDKYYIGDKESAEKAFDMVGGICYNKSKNY